MAKKKESPTTDKQKPPLHKPTPPPSPQPNRKTNKQQTKTKKPPQTKKTPYHKKNNGLRDLKSMDWQTLLFNILPEFYLMNRINY